VGLPEDRETRLRCYRNALQNWNFKGYVFFKPLVEEWLANELPNYKLREVAQELHRYVKAGGEIDEQKETRPEFVSYDFHYDLRVKFGDRRLYFETVLLCEDPEDPDDPQIQVVSVRDV
jgi:hypothetical protein